MARPKYEPTHTDRATVRTLAALGAKHEDIARCLGDGERIFGITARTMKKHFRRDLETAQMQVKASAMSQLIAAINRGENWAIKFFLERRGGMSEAHRLVDKDGEDRGLTLADIDQSIDAHDAAEAAAANR